MNDEGLRQLQERRERLASAGGLPASVKADLDRAKRLDCAGLRTLQWPGAAEMLARSSAAARMASGMSSPFAWLTRPPAVAALARSGHPFPSPRISSALWQVPATSALLKGMRMSLSRIAGSPHLSEQVRLASSTLGRFGQMSRFAEQLAEPMRRLHELFEGYDEDERRVLEAIVPLGWLLSPLMGLHTIRAIARELDRRPEAEVDEALVGYFNHERCTEIVGKLCADPLFADQREALEEALAVHRAGHYRSAVRGWFAEIDAVAERAFGIKRLFKAAAQRNGEKLRLTLSNATGSEEPLLDALVGILRRAVADDPDPHVPQRDLVAHGRAQNFADERSSIQLLLVLEVLHYFAPDIESARSDEPVPAVPTE